MNAILIVGAGAVGRGFIAPIFAGRYEIDVVDTDANLVAALRERGSYETSRTRGRDYEILEVPVRRAVTPPEVSNVEGYEAVFISVGPRSYLDCAETARRARATFVLENLRESGSRLRQAAAGSIHFGIPDVIVSNTAPPELLSRDPLCVVAERGELILEDGGYELADVPELVRCGPADLDARWACKLFMHGACHAVAAYLGARSGHRFIHEAMDDPAIGSMVDRAMRATCEALIREGTVTAPMAEAYLARELTRFRNALLFDPIARVARDPLRKLGRDDRLVGALRLVGGAGLDATPFLLAINAALQYCADEGDGAEPRGAEEILESVCGLTDAALIRDIRAADAPLRAAQAAGGERARPRKA